MAQPTLIFGPEYPAVLDHVDGTQMPLISERRWTRLFRHPSTRAVFRISRFMDGSTALTLDDLRNGWANWPSDDRQDFCESVAWLRDRADFPEILRFLAQNGTSDTWSSISLAVAGALPQHEAFALLLHALDATGAAGTTNILQALARTRHPSASTVIKDRLESTLRNSETWTEAPPQNLLASTAVFAIKHLTELGLDPSEFDAAVHALAAHPNARNRKICQDHLWPRYSWLHSPADQSG